MERLRPPAVAGAFYPDRPDALRAMVRDFLAAAAPAGAAPWAVIAPHAGYVYSGPVAGHAYARLALGRERIRRVLLLGPSHHVAFPGLAVSPAAGFATPLGVLPVDPEGVAALLELPYVAVSEAAHAPEHSLEVQLPFLQVALGEVALVPVLAGRATPAQVAEALERLGDDAGTAVVVSSDLSHYLPYAEARRLDQATAEAIRDLRPEALGADAACGALPVRGLLAAARARGLRAEVLDLRTSADTAGGAGPVVGYGAFAFA